MRTALDDLNGDLAASWDVRLVTHTGVNTGEIAVSTTPDGEPFTLGDPVNVAQRLQSAAAPGEILIGADHGAAAARERAPRAGRAACG